MNRRQIDRWALLVGNAIAFALAMTYDRIVNDIGPFELTQYRGLAIVWCALVVTAPFVRIGWTVRTTG